MFSAPPTPSSTDESALQTSINNYFSNSANAENSAQTAAVSAGTTADNVGLLPDYYSPTSAPNPYQFPFLLPTDWTFQFSTPDGSQLAQSPLANQFAQFPSIYNPTNTRTPFSDFYGGHSPMVQYSANGHLKKSTAGRKPKDLPIEMEDEDEERKQKRRQRNKEAAARCRQRRIDQTSELISQVNQYKKENDSCQRMIEKLRNELDHCYAFLNKHECKVPPGERQLPNVPPRPQNVYQPLQLLAMPPRSETAQSMTSQHSSSTSSSEQHSPTEEYKPSIDQLKTLPPISMIQQQQQQQQVPIPVPTSNHLIPLAQNNLPSTSTSSAPPAPINDDGFREPERKIPRITDTLTSIASSDDVERPSMLPILQLGKGNGSQPLSTPSRLGPTPINSENYSNLFGNVEMNDFLSTNTGLTPSGQPVLNFTTSQSPMDPNREADLRPL